MQYRIHILPNDKTIFAEQGDLLLNVLSKSGYIVPAPCAGNGTCGKCKVGILDNAQDAKTAQKVVYVSACKTRVEGDMIVLLGEYTGSGLAEFSMRNVAGEESGLGVALDIGTTTLAACMVDLQTGAILRKTSCLNPQAAFGADVLSRIAACQDGNLQTLQTLILDKTAELLQELAKGENIAQLVVAANTTMLHLFLGVDPKTIGVAPFTPVFTETQYLFGKRLGLPVERIKLLPSVSGYIGADISAGVLACDMWQDKRTALFVDIGTNGEIVLSHQGKLYATSTAAGPALEGACIECGLGGVDGAIDKVDFQDGVLTFTTINGSAAKGICGSGLVDLIAVLLGEDLIDENGTWNEKCDSVLYGNRKDDRFYLTDMVYISQKDIRQFQLAKAAISAGMETLLYECDVDVKDVETLYIAGGLGYYLNIQNSGVVGLLPKNFLKKAKAVGNSSLQGAMLCMLKQEYQDQVEKIANMAEVIELSCSRYFQDAYIESISFHKE